MPLIANEHQYDLIEDFSPPDSYCEGIGSISVFVGYHKDLASGQKIEITKTYIERNHQGKIIHQDDEEWEYEMHGSPPRAYRRATMARPYLPDVNEGMFLREVEVVNDVYMPFAAFTPGTHLSRVTEIAGWVIYDLNPTREGPSTEGKEKLEEQGLNPEGETGIVVASGRSWKTALAEDSIDQRSTASQVSYWRNPMITETEIVINSADGSRKYKTRKLHYKGAHSEITGPETVRNQGYEYRLPVPIPAPEIKLSSGIDGIHIEVIGGAAQWRVPRFKRLIEIHPNGYQIFRKVVSEPSRTASTDPWELYDTPPAEKNRTTVFTTDDSTDLDGTPASSIPAQESYNEPGDAGPPDDPGWELIAEPDNLGDRTPGSYSHANALDDDLVATGVYEYFAVAVLGGEIGEESNHAEASWGGATTGSSITSRVRQTDEGTEVEVLPPDDPGLLGFEYGEVFEFEVPALIGSDFSYDDLVDMISPVFARADAGHIVIKVDCTIPLLDLERGQLVKLNPDAWKTIGNGLVLDQSIQDGAWFVQGFNGSARVNGDTWDVNFQFTAEDNST